jgi:hypothetical protein
MADIDYGTDIYCKLDTDDTFSDVTGIPLLEQDLLHRLMNDEVLSSEEDAEAASSWGYDVRHLLGLPVQRLPPFRAIIADRLSQDDRVESISVEFTPSVKDGAIEDVIIEVSGESKDGPFDFTTSISELTLSRLENL